jgi:glyoxylase-like metal-dependent hydrolase (beta-lactamase superfamily II)
VPLVPGWREVALWWPEQGTLAVGDTLGTVGYFLAPGERLGVHPLVRARPPRALRGLAAEHVLCGHGKGVHGPGTAAELERAVREARRRLPAAWLAAVRHWIPRRRR